jgi:hypothetical protein
VNRAPEDKKAAAAAAAAVALLPPETTMTSPDGSAVASSSGKGFAAIAKAVSVTQKKPKIHYEVRAFTKESLEKINIRTNNLIRKDDHETKFAMFCKLSFQGRIHRSTWVQIKPPPPFGDEKRALLSKKSTKKIQNQEKLR